MRKDPLQYSCRAARRHRSSREHSLRHQHPESRAARTYVARHGLPASPEELDGHAGIAYSRAGALSPWQVRDIDGQVRQVRIQRQVSLDDVQAIAAAAIEGFGLAWLPSWLRSRYEKTGELVVVMNSCGMLPQDIHAVWPQTRYLPSKTRRAIDAPVAEIPGMIAG
jgi:DNA-binding transcriptional LysR family regulator